MGEKDGSPEGVVLYNIDLEAFVFRRSHLDLLPTLIPSVSFDGPWDPAYKLFLVVQHRF